MTVYSSIEEVPGGFPRSAVAIGKFDGVHAGHRAVIDAMREHAEADGLRSVVVTFDRNPLAVLDPSRCPDPLVGLQQKVELLTMSGVDDVVVLPFTRELAALEPETFVRRILVDVLNAAHVFVGADFRFGARGMGTVLTLHELGGPLGFRTTVVADVDGPAGGRTSSSAIRAALAAGDVELATGMLGRAPLVRGRVVHGLKRGRELGWPTANLETQPDGFVPADGVYAGWLIDHDREGAPRYPAAVSVGVNPTFDDVTRSQVEAHVIDGDLDLYGHLVDIVFVRRLRGMEAFRGVEALVAQIGEDVERARCILSDSPE